MVADAGGCTVGVGGAALSSVSSMRRVVMRNREVGRRFSKMAAGAKRNCCNVKRIMEKV